MTALPWRPPSGRPSGLGSDLHNGLRNGLLRALRSALQSALRSALRSGPRGCTAAKLPIRSRPSPPLEPVWKLYTLRVLDVYALADLYAGVHSRPN